MNLYGISRELQEIREAVARRAHGHSLYEQGAAYAHAQVQQHGLEGARRRFLKDMHVKDLAGLERKLEGRSVGN